MSDRRLRLLVALALVTARAGDAQSTSTPADSAVREIRALDSIMLARVRDVDSVRRSLVRSAPPLELRVGALRVRTDSSLAPRVRLVTQSIAGYVERRQSAIITARVGARVPTVTRDSTRWLFGRTPTIAFKADTTNRWSMIGQRQVPTRASIGDLTDALGDVVEQIAMQGTDSALAAWVMIGRIPLRPATTADVSDAYVELATTESVALRRCRAHDVAACLDALGLDSVPERRLARWYAPQDYRSVVRTAMPDREDSVAVAAWVRCRAQADDGSCRSAAESLPNARVPLPLSGAVRYTFLREVLDAGGRGAFDRLQASAGPLRQRFELATNEPLDRTVIRWLDHVERSRPERMHVSPTIVLASLGWIGVILGLPLTRRARWA
jgi:hypothetical protein